MVIKTGKAVTNSFIVEAINKKLADNPRLNRLHDYYMGKHDILLRHYDDPTKPNNRTVANYCRKIADFLTAFLVGVSIKYEAPQQILDTLNFNDESEHTQEVVRNLNIFGMGAELHYTDTDGLPRFANIDPRESIFITDDTIEANLIAYIRFYPNADEPDLYNVILYDNDNYTEYRLSQAVSELTQLATTPHYYKDVPAVMYQNGKEMEGAFEGVIPLQNALNTILSDETNDFEAFSDAILVLTGLLQTKPEDIAKMKQDRVLLLDGETSAQWLIKNQNSQHNKELKESFVSKIHELGCVPDVEKLGSIGSSGVALRYKLMHTEMYAAKQERAIQRGLQRRIELLYNLLTIADPDMGTFWDVGIEFERNYIMLSDDALNQKRLDLNLVENGLLSRETFLLQHKGMTPEEAQRELQRVALESYQGVYNAHHVSSFAPELIEKHIEDYQMYRELERERMN